MLVPRLLSLALLLLETDTEANVAAKVAPGVTVLLSRTQVSMVGAPRTAAIDPVRPRGRPIGVDRGMIRRVHGVPVCCPLPHTAVHIEKAPRAASTQRAYTRAWAVSAALRPGQELKRVNVDFPTWMI